MHESLVYSQFMASVNKVDPTIQHCNMGSILHQHIDPCPSLPTRGTHIHLDDAIEKAIVLPLYQSKVNGRHAELLPRICAESALIMLNQDTSKCRHRTSENIEKKKQQ